MSTFTISIDTIIHVFNSVQDTLIGQRSSYITSPHPGTNKTIDGWKWNGRNWPDDGEFRASAFAPSIWDATLSGIDEDYLQSGFGDNDDLLLLGIEEVLLSGVDVWAPQLNHGYFYIRDGEWYLFSDYYLTQYFTITGVDSGEQVLTLTDIPKPTIPIMIRSWEFDRINAQHEIHLNFRKKVSFTVGGTEPEYLVDTDFSPPQLRLNGEYSQVFGTPIVTTVSGTADPATINNLEMVGISDGNEDQSFFTTYSPLDSSQTVEVWSWVDPNWPTEWTVIDPLNEFTVSGDDVQVDMDRGTLLFGDGLYGNIPNVGYCIGVHYTTAIAAQYEPKDTRDDIIAYSAAADVNPIASAVSKGFVQITTESVDPASIILSSSLPQVNPYLIELGNNIGKLIAEVKNFAGELLEGQDVTFEILDPQIGTFGATATEVSAITSSDGRAKTFYTSPITVQTLGQATTTVSHSGGDTIVEVTDVVEPTTISGIYIYRVHEYDEVLGIPEAAEATYYIDYFNEETIVTGIQATQFYEEQHRTIHEMLPPETYTTAELSKGKKTMLLTTRSGTMNSHTGYIETGVFVPLLPDLIENIGTSAAPILKMTYQGILLDLPGTADTKAYFIIGDARTNIRAFVTNQRTSRRIFSNTIGLEIQIPDAVNGTFFCNVLNDIPNGLLTKHKNVYDIADGSIDATSGIEDFYQAYIDERDYVPVSGIFESYIEWFRRTRRGDVIAMTTASMAPPDGIGDPTLSGLEDIIPVDCPAEIPLGFRLKSTDVTLASILDQVTYLDPNDVLPSGHFLGS